MEEDNMVQVILGDFLLTVDTDTANKLNDDVYAQQYLQRIIDIENSRQNAFSGEPEATTSLSSQENGGTSNKSKVWTTSRVQTETDEVATTYFLTLRKKLNARFSDKCTPKDSLWMEIAKSMNEAGFFVGVGVEGREKCRQKFVNLQSSYMKYKDKKQSTGKGKREKPQFFYEIDVILGDKDKANPAFLIDSLNIRRTPLQGCPSSKDSGDKENKSSTFRSAELSLSSCSSTSYSGTSESAVLNSENDTPTTTNRFKKCVKIVTPKKNEISENCYTLAERAEQRQKIEFQTMIDLMREESQKRHVQVMTLISALNKNNSHKNKRKRDNSESD